MRQDVNNGQACISSKVEVGDKIDYKNVWGKAAQTEEMVDAIAVGSVLEWTRKD